MVGYNPLIQFAEEHGARNWLLAYIEVDTLHVVAVDLETARDMANRATGVIVFRHLNKMIAILYNQDVAALAESIPILGECMHLALLALYSERRHATGAYDHIQQLQL